MKSIRVSLVNNDHVVQAMRNLDLNESAIAFLRQVREELVTGDTAFIEIQGLEKDPVTFAVSHFE